MTVSSFAITRYGQCCRYHIVGQRAVSDISEVLVVEELSLSLCSESNCADLFYACYLLYLELLFCFKCQTYLTYNIAVCISLP